MSGSSRRFSQRNLQRPASQPGTPVRRVQATPREDDPDPAVAFDVRSSNPTNNFLIGLREIVLKALLSDIEASGGFSAPTFSLKHICNSKPDIYGPPGSEQRRQVQNKVQKLRKLAPFEYLSVLNYYRVSSGALTRSFRPPDSAASISEESLSEPVTPVRLQRRTVANPSPCLERHQIVPFDSPPHLPHRSSSRQLLSASRRLAMNTQLFYDDFNLDEVDVIAVNLDHPERNREVMVFTVNDVQNQGNMYNCFTIMLRIDPRDAAVTDRCTAYVVSETELLISYPALEYFFFTDSAQRNERLKIGTDYDSQVQLAQDICINDVRRAPQRVVKRLLLRFPQDITLANVFNQYSYVIRSKMPMDYASTSLFGDPPVKVLTTHMQWMIADLNTHRKAIIEAAEATPLDVLSNNFARIFYVTSATSPFAAPVESKAVSSATGHFLPPRSFAASVHQREQPLVSAFAPCNSRATSYASATAPVPRPPVILQAFPTEHAVAPDNPAALHSNPFAASECSRTLATRHMLSAGAPVFAAAHRQTRSALALANPAAVHNNPFAAPQRQHGAPPATALPALVAEQKPAAVLLPLGATLQCTQPPTTTNQCFMPHATMQSTTAAIAWFSPIATSSRLANAAASAAAIADNTVALHRAALQPQAIAKRAMSATTSSLVVPAAAVAASLVGVLPPPAVATNTWMVPTDTSNQSLISTTNRTNADVNADIKMDIAMRGAIHIGPSPHHLMTQPPMVPAANTGTTITARPSAGFRIHTTTTLPILPTIPPTSKVVDKVPISQMAASVSPLMAMTDTAVLNVKPLPQSATVASIASAPDVDNAESNNKLWSSMHSCGPFHCPAPGATLSDATQNKTDIGFAIGVATATRPPKGRLMDIGKQRAKRPPATPTPMRKELGRPRKRTCVANGVTPLMLTETPHLHTQRRSSPRLRGMVPSPQNNTPEILHMDRDKNINMTTSAVDAPVSVLNDAEMIDIL